MWAEGLHWLAVARLFEDLWGHVARGATGGGQDVELLFIHNAGESKVGDEKIGIVLWVAEEQVLGLEIAMDNAMVMQVGDGGENGAHQVCSIRFKVRALATDAVKQLAAEGEIGDQIHCNVSDERGSRGSRRSHHEYNC